MLFLQGTRDDLAEVGLVRELCAALGPRAALREFAGANHSFEVTKASGTTGEAVRKSLATAIAEWLHGTLARAR
jgi:hypothetical protein